eukprot:618747_1
MSSLCVLLFTSISTLSSAYTVISGTFTEDWKFTSTPPESSESWWYNPTYGAFDDLDQTSSSPKDGQVWGWYNKDSGDPATTIGRDFKCSSYAAVTVTLNVYFCISGSGGQTFWYKRSGLSTPIAVTYNQAGDGYGSWSSRGTGVCGNTVKKTQVMDTFTTNGVFTVSFTKKLSAMYDVSTSSNSQVVAFNNVRVVCSQITTPRPTQSPTSQTNNPTKRPTTTPTNMPQPTLKPTDGPSSYGTVYTNPNDLFIYILIASAACVCCVCFIALKPSKCTRRKYKDEGYENPHVKSSPMDAMKHERVHTQSTNVDVRNVQERLEAVMNQKEANESVSADDEDIEQLYVSHNTRGGPMYVQETKNKKKMKLYRNQSGVKIGDVLPPLPLDDRAEGAPLCKRCIDCGKQDVGKVYDGDGLFYCNQCWKYYGQTFLGNKQTEYI